MIDIQIKWVFMVDFYYSPDLDNYKFSEQEVEYLNDQVKDINEINRFLGCYGWKYSVITGLCYKEDYTKELRRCLFDIIISESLKQGRERYVYPTDYYNPPKETERFMLITTDAWFYAPDGKPYKAAWGRVRFLNDSEFLGIKTNARSTNWYAVVGVEGSAVSIAGCQIHYAVDCPNPPNVLPVEDYSTDTKGINKYDRPTNIYLAEPTGK